MKRLAFAMLIALFVAGSAAAQEPVERFDVSGMPARPGTFLGQQITELIKVYRPGDLASAAQIQRKLATFYMQMGDSARARVARERADGGDTAPQAAPRTVPTAPPSPAPTNGGNVALPSKPSLQPGTSGFSGKYYVMQDRSTMQTWEFARVGTYLFTRVSSGSGTSVRNSERGTYAVSGSTMVLRPSSQAGGYVTPGVGDRSTALGGNSEITSGQRRVSLRLVGPGGRDGIVLDGVRMKPKSW